MIKLENTFVELQKKFAKAFVEFRFEAILRHK